MNYIELNQLIKENDEIVIFRHIQPDFDAYGSQIGLKYIIQENYPEKNVLTYGKDVLVNDYAEEMDNPSDVSDALCIVVDTSTRDRIDDAVYFNGKVLAKVDHHLKSEPYCENAYVDDECGSCSELIAQFAIENQLKISTKAASWLYIGALTDTVRFSIDKVNSSTFNVLSKLCESNIDIPMLNRVAYDQSIKVYQGATYFRNKIIFKEDSAFLIIKKEEQRKMNLSDKNCKEYSRLMSNIIGVDKYCTLLENDDGTYSVSMRSHKPKVVHICAHYGGGGHFLACGCDHVREDQLDEFMAMVLAAK